ncbi:DUF418 domain-containing protein [Corynebacterium aquatimens]|uniref:DUF418 domain-containing protein n=1 Tax=Corynebacterium TaxID=1716 RepID=UPI001F473BEB|nr:MULTISPECIES: DUF418 domain-containing protein [Corynebacterium]QYH19885.1 DUF418 domain-containing protein [Corynebacterium aquatimens]UIZ92956.1 DUF418 domain-containing protein [Corynebacterium sp. CNCTC7651]
METRQLQPLHRPPQPAPRRPRPQRSATTVRYLAPDVARGMALLGIILANIPTAWLPHYGAEYAEHFGGYSGAPTLAEQLCIVFQAMFVHVRGLPMFSTLLGVGIGMIAVSLAKRGYTPKEARRLMIRRYAWLLALGAVHMALLFSGDIMVTYGCLGIIVAFLLRRSDTALRWIAGVCFALMALGTATPVITFGGDPDLLADKVGTIPVDAPTTGAELLNNLGTVLVSVIATPFFALLLLPPVLVGYIWGRAGVLGNVADHRRELTCWVWVAVTVILLVGLPWGLSAIGVLPYEWEATLHSANVVMGLLTGPGIVAAVALALEPMQRRVEAGAGTPWWLRPFVALGKRSMSGYVGQSLIMVPILLTVPASTLLALTIPQQMWLGVLVWAITLVAACLLELAGQPGPFERLHRRLSYGKQGLRPQISSTSTSGLLLDDASRTATPSQPTSVATMWEPGASGESASARGVVSP